MMQLKTPAPFSPDCICDSNRLFRHLHKIWCAKLHAPWIIKLQKFKLVSKLFEYIFRSEAPLQVTLLSVCMSVLLAVLYYILNNAININITHIFSENAHPLTHWLGPKWNYLGKLRNFSLSRKIFEECHFVQNFPPLPEKLSKIQSDLST